MDNLISINAPPIITIAGLSHRFADRLALNNLSLQIHRGEWFSFLGPNGGGKTTLFRLLSTLIPPREGSARILGLELRRDVAAIRRRLGVVFQSASLDKRLTVRENIRHQAALYGIRGRELVAREADLLERFRIADRANETTEKLSGGLRRRVELAKSLIHRPSVLLLDEPSTGLDPGARADLWGMLRQLRNESQVTVVMTTHLLDEADHSDRLAILDRGSLVALGAPDELRATVGGDSITIQTDDPMKLAGEFRERFQRAATVVDGRVRMELADGHQWIPKIVDAFPGRIASITLGKPTLEDVFIAKTGHRLFTESGATR